MNKNKLKLATGLLCGVLLMPFVSEAATATKLNDHTVLFTIDFTFTEATFDQSVPIAAKYGVTYQDRVDTVGYNIKSKNTVAPEISKVNGLILSRAPINGTKYEVKAETSANFTLVMLATFEKPISNDLDAYITKLPYFIEGRRTTVHQNQLDEIEHSQFDFQN